MRLLFSASVVAIGLYLIYRLGKEEQRLNRDLDTLRFLQQIINEIQRLPLEAQPTFKQ